MLQEDVSETDATVINGFRYRLTKVSSIPLEDREFKLNYTWTDYPDDYQVSLPMRETWNQQEKDNESNPRMDPSDSNSDIFLDTFYFCFTSQDSSPSACLTCYDGYFLYKFNQVLQNGNNY